MGTGTKAGFSGGRWSMGETVLLPGKVWEAKNVQRNALAPSFLPKLKSSAVVPTSQRPLTEAIYKSAEIVLWVGRPWSQISFLCTESGSKGVHPMADWHRTQLQELNYRTHRAILLKKGRLHSKDWVLRKFGYKKNIFKTCFPSSSALLDQTNVKWEHLHA